ncbi:MAG: hypothetical protein JXB14_00190 [Candidatus Altiarchaeota archaeon]|nr:hypothetical protein [Candidatus Altiarchaeota archaeon]
MDYSNLSMIIPLGAGILTVIGALFFFHARRIVMLKDKIEKTRSILVRGITEGPVSLEGKVVPIARGVLKSPFLRRDCVYYSYAIKRLAPKEFTNYWKPYRRGSKAVDFYLEDETGKALINGQKAVFDVSEEFTSTYFADNVPGGIGAFLKESRLVEKLTKAFTLPREFRFSEASLAPGSWAYVLGYATKNPHPKKSPEGKASYLVRGGLNNQLFIFSRHKVNLLSALGVQYRKSLTLGAVSFVLGIAALVISLIIFLKI